MKFKIFGKEISVKKEEEKKSVLPENLSERAFADYVKEQMKNTGRTEAQILGEVFKDGWLVWMVEESGGSAQLELSQLFKAGKKPDDKVKEYIRLRENFAPISNCVDYLIDKIIGGGIGVVIDDPSDKNQKEHKEELERLLEDIYQDEYKRGLRTILPILVNEALTTGSAATEITYDGDKTFWDYAEISETAKTVQIKGKPVEIVLYNTKEPKWNTDLKGLDRLKIIDRAYERFVVQRDPKTWEIKYWILDEGKSVQPITLPSGIVVRKLVGKTVAGTYLHPWQVFWLTLKQRGFDVKGESVIKPVYEVSILLEKILKAVGEGIHRAGNKKYFIICGSADRPWSTPHIRNVLQQLKEASKKNWSTIPMPMGFDIKDIGGEVFEADQVVNYFLKVIAGGMKVPAKVLGIEVREQKEYSYTEYRSNLLLAIKHQLFKRHVWCKHGMKRTKQGGKGEEPVYIPNPKIKIEGLFTTPLEELEIYIKMLNPANPITPQLKLEAEKGIAKLMGWDMIDFPTQEEYEKKLREREEQALKFGKSRVVKVPSEKEQGEPEPQTVERQEKRLEGMRKKGETEKGKSKPMGGTREPAEVKLKKLHNQ